MNASLLSVLGEAVGSLFHSNRLHTERMGRTSFSPGVSYCLEIIKQLYLCPVTSRLHASLVILSIIVFSSEDSCSPVGTRLEASLSDMALGHTHLPSSLSWGSAPH